MATSQDSRDEAAPTSVPTATSGHEAPGVQLDADGDAEAEKDVKHEAPSVEDAVDTSAPVSDEGLLPETLPEGVVEGPTPEDGALVKKEEEAVPDSLPLVDVSKTADGPVGVCEADPKVTEHVLIVTELSDDIKKVSDDVVHVTEVKEDVTKVTEVTEVSEDVATVNEDITKVSQDVTKVTLKVADLSEDGTDLSKEVTKLSDDIVKVSDDLTNVSETSVEVTKVNGNVTKLSEDVTEVSDIVRKVGELSNNLTNVGEPSEDLTKVSKDVVNVSQDVEKVSEINVGVTEVSKIDTELNENVTKVSDGVMEVRAPSKDLTNVGELYDDKTKVSDEITKVSELNIDVTKTNGDVVKLDDDIANVTTVSENIIKVLEVTNIARCGDAIQAEVAEVKMDKPGVPSKKEVAGKTQIMEGAPSKARTKRRLPWNDMPLADEGPDPEAAFYLGLAASIRDNLELHLDGRLGPSGLTSPATQDTGNTAKLEVTVGVGEQATSVAAPRTEAGGTEETREASPTANRFGVAKKFTAKRRGERSKRPQIRGLSFLDITAQLAVERKRAAAAGLLAPPRTRMGSRPMPALTMLGGTDAMASLGLARTPNLGLPLPEPVRLRPPPIPRPPPPAANLSPRKLSLRQRSTESEDGGKDTRVGEVTLLANGERPAFIEDQGTDTEPDPETAVVPAEAGVSVESSNTAARHDAEPRGSAFSGDWVRPRTYVCAACNAPFADVYDLQEHKWGMHPNAWVCHYEFYDAHLSRTPADTSRMSLELYKRFLRPQGVLAAAISLRDHQMQCTKCQRMFSVLPEFHRHILDCGGDTTWMSTMVAASPGGVGARNRSRKWRPFGARRRRGNGGGRGRRGMKRSIRGTPGKSPGLRQRSRATDAESIQRMIANLPAKRSTRRAINFQEDIKTRSQATISSNRLLRKRFKVAFTSSVPRQGDKVETVNARRLSAAAQLVSAALKFPRRFPATETVKPAKARKDVALLASKASSKSMATAKTTSAKALLELAKKGKAHSKSGPKEAAPSVKTAALVKRESKGLPSPAQSVVKSVKVVAGVKSLQKRAPLQTAPAKAAPAKAAGTSSTGEILRAMRRAMMESEPAAIAARNIRKATDTVTQPTPSASGDEPVIVCSHCAGSYTNRTAYMRHRKGCVGASPIKVTPPADPPPRVPCNSCGVLLANIKSRDRHLKRCPVLGPRLAAITSKGQAGATVRRILAAAKATKAANTVTVTAKVKSLIAKPAKGLAPTAKTAKVAAPSPKATKMAVSAPKAAKVVVPAPKVAKAAVPSPKVAKAAVPSPKVAKPAVPTPKSAKAAEPSSKAAKVIVPSKATKMAVPSPKVVKSVVPTPKGVKAAAPSPKAAKVSAVPSPKVAKTVISSPKVVPPKLSKTADPSPKTVTKPSASAPPDGGKLSPEGECTTCGKHFVYRARLSAHRAICRPVTRRPPHRASRGARDDDVPLAKLFRVGARSSPRRDGRDMPRLEPVGGLDLAPPAAECPVLSPFSDVAEDEDIETVTSADRKTRLSNPKSESEGSETRVLKATKPRLSAPKRPETGALKRRSARVARTQTASPGDSASSRDSGVFVDQESDTGDTGKSQSAVLKNPSAQDVVVKVDVCNFEEVVQGKLVTTGAQSESKAKWLERKMGQKVLVRVKSVEAECRAEKDTGAGQEEVIIVAEVIRAKCAGSQVNICQDKQENLVADVSEDEAIELDRNESEEAQASHSQRKARLDTSLVDQIKERGSEFATQGTKVESETVQTKVVELKERGRKDIAIDRVVAASSGSAKSEERRRSGSATHPRTETRGTPTKRRVSWEGEAVGKRLRLALEYGIRQIDDDVLAVATPSSRVQGEVESLVRAVVRDPEFPVDAVSQEEPTLLVEKCRAVTLLPASKIPVATDITTGTVPLTTLSGALLQEDVIQDLSSALEIPEKGTLGNTTGKCSLNARKTETETTNSVPQTNSSTANSVCSDTGENPPKEAEFVKTTDKIPAEIEPINIVSISKRTKPAAKNRVSMEVSQDKSVSGNDLVAKGSQQSKENPTQLPIEVIPSASNVQSPSVEPAGKNDVQPESLIQPALKETGAESKVAEAESKVPEAESKVTEAESKASEPALKETEAESKVTEAETRVTNPALKVDEPEKKATESELKVAVADSKVTEAESKASEPALKETEADSKVTEADSNVTEPELKVTEAELKVAVADLKVTEPKLKVAEAESKVAEAELKVAVAELKVAEAELKVAVADSKVTETESKIAKATSKIAEAESKVAEAESKVTEAELKIAEAASKVTDAESKIAAPESKVTEAESKVAEPESKVTEAELKIAEAESKVAEAELKIAEAESKVTGAELKIPEPESNVTEAESNVTEAESKVIEEESKVTEAELKIAEPELKVTEAESKVTESEWKVTEAKSKIAAPESKVTKTELKVTEGESKIAAPESKVTEAESKIAAPESKVTEAESKIAAPESKVTEAESKIAEAESKITEAESKITEPDSKAPKAEMKALEPEVMTTKAAEPALKMTEPEKKVNGPAVKDTEEGLKVTEAAAEKHEVRPNSLDTAKRKAPKSKVARESTPKKSAPPKKAPTPVRLREARRTRCALSYEEMVDVSSEDSPDEDSCSTPIKRPRQTSKSKDVPKVTVPSLKPKDPVKSVVQSPSSFTSSKERVESLAIERPPVQEVVQVPAPKVATVEVVPAPEVPSKPLVSKKPREPTLASVPSDPVPTKPTWSGRRLGDGDGQCLTSHLSCSTCNKHYYSKSTFATHLRSVTHVLRVAQAMPQQKPRASSEVCVPPKKPEKVVTPRVPDPAPASRLPCEEPREEMHVMGEERLFDVEVAPPRESALEEAESVAREECRRRGEERRAASKDSVEQWLAQQDPLPAVRGKAASVRGVDGAPPAKRRRVKVTARRSSLPLMASSSSSSWADSATPAVPAEIDRLHPLACETLPPRRPSLEDLTSASRLAGKAPCSSGCNVASKSRGRRLKAIPRRRPSKEASRAKSRILQSVYLKQATPLMRDLRPTPSEGDDRRLSVFDFQDEESQESALDLRFASKPKPPPPSVDPFDALLASGQEEPPRARVGRPPKPRPSTVDPGEEPGPCKNAISQAVVDVSNILVLEPSRRRAPVCYTELWDDLDSDSSVDSAPSPSDPASERVESSAGSWADCRPSKPMYRDMWEESETEDGDEAANKSSVLCCVFGKARRPEPPS